MPGDNYYKPQPEFVYEKIEGDDLNHVFKMTLPPNGPFLGADRSSEKESQPCQEGSMPRGL